MSGSFRYLERTVRLGGDPLAAVTVLASSGVFGSYVVIEREGRYAIAGDVLAELRADRDGLSCCVDGDNLTAYQGTPFRSMARALDALPIRDWRVYGWVAFELSYIDAGLQVDDGLLAHLIVPRTEVILRAGTALLRSTDLAALDQVAGLLAAANDRSTSIDQSVPVDISIGGERYREAVREAVQEINTTALQKVILSRIVPVDFEVDLIRSFEYGRRFNSPARSYLIDLGDLKAAGFSPEIVITTDGKDIVTQPLAGTRARLADPVADLRLRTELLGEAKEIYEHAVSVKAAVEEFGTVCEPASIVVERFMNVLERGTVQHIASQVRGRLAADRDVWDALRAVFSPVTTSGYPKDLAYDCIRRLEPIVRGPYAGAVLMADWQGDMDATLVLRTVYQAEGRTWLRAGAGIVGASKPDREYEETCEKLRSISKFLVPAQSLVPEVG